MGAGQLHQFPGIDLDRCPKLADFLGFDERDIQLTVLKRRHLMVAFTAFIIIIVYR